MAPQGQQIDSPLSKKPSSIARGIRAFASRLSRPIGSSRPSLSSMGSDPSRGKLFVLEAEMLGKIYKELSGHGPGDGVDCETFIGFMALPPLWSQRFFARIDRTGRGLISCEEFIDAVATFCRGSMPERIKWMFDIFDLNGDGKVQRSEVQAMLGALPDWHAYVRRDALHTDAMLCVERLRSRDSTSVLSPSPQSILPAPYPFVPTDGVVLEPKVHGSSSSSSDGGEAPSSCCSDRMETDDVEFGAEQISGVFSNYFTTEYSDEAWPSEEVEVRRASSSLAPPSRTASGISSVAEPPPTAPRVELHDESPMTELEDIVSAVFQTFGRPEGLSFSDFSRWVLVGGALGLLDIPHAGLREERWSLQGLAFNRPNNAGDRRPSTSPCASRAPSVELSPFAGPALHLGHDQYFKLRRLFTKPAAPRVVGAAVSQFIQHPLDVPTSLVAPPTSIATADGAGCEYPRMGRETSIKFPSPEYPQASTYPSSNASLVGALMGDWRREPLFCHKCFSPFIMCPRCHSRFPQLRLRDHHQVTVECENCLEGKPHEFCFCWFCLWNFSEALELIGRSTILKEGRLWKVGRHTHHWRGRYYVLIDQTMYYYSHRRDAAPRGFMYLDGCTVSPIGQTTPADSGPTTRRAATGGKFGISIAKRGGVGPRRDLYASTKQEADHWVAVLSQTLTRLDVDDYYEMGREVGRGRFSVVYSAINKADGTERAVKVIRKSRMSDQEKDQIKSEMSILRLLRHRYVVRLFEIVDADDTIYIIMEMVRGGELYELLRRKGRLPEQQTKRFVLQLLETVTYLHDCGIIHRDIKPENILLTDLSPTANIKIADFGLSCLCSPNEVLRQPCGTLAYAAPEVFAGCYSHAVDVWAIGVVAFLLLRGRLPFPIDAPHARTMPRPTFDDDGWREVSRDAIDFLCKSLEPDPKERISALDAIVHPWLTGLQV